MPRRNLKKPARGRKPSAIRGDQLSQSKTKDPRAERWALLATFGILIFLSLLAFANSFLNGFAFDDEPLIVDNTRIKSLGDLPRLFATDYWARVRPEKDVPVLHPLYRPLTLATFALNFAVGGLNPFGYHLVNLLLHLAVCWLLYDLARRIGSSWSAALAASALFAVHPLHTEAVTGITGRAEVLMTLAVLLSLKLYIHGRGSRPGAVPITLASWGAFAVGLLSKEQAIVLPVLLVLYDLSTWQERGTGMRKGFIQSAWSRYLGYVLLLGAFLVLRAVVVGRFFEAPDERPFIFIVNPLVLAGWSSRVLTALKVAGRYLWLFIWPQKLSADYSYNAIPLTSSLGDPAVLAAVVAWGALVVLGAYSLRRGSRPAFFAVALTGITFLPASNLLFTTGTIMGERLFYLPSAGLCLLIGVGMDRMAAWAQTAGVLRAVTRVNVGVSALVLLVLTTRTIQRNRDWRSTETLMQSAVQVVPNSAKVHYFLGIFHFGRLQHLEALREFEEALRLYPEYPARSPEFAQWIGVALLEAGRVPEAIDSFNASLRVWPSYPFIYDGLGLAYARIGKWQEALAAHQRALVLLENALGPDHHDIAQTLNNLAALYANLGKYDVAEGHYRRALAIREKSLGREHLEVAQTLNNMGSLYAAQGQYAQAEPFFQRALAIREKALPPDHPVLAASLSTLALLYSTQGRYAQAEPLYQRALAIREKSLGADHPSVAVTLENYAAVLRKTGREAEAAVMEARATAIRAKATR